MLAPASSTEVAELINQLKAAAGVDELESLPIKRVSVHISTILCHIINTMLELGIFPEQLKIAKVRPISRVVVGMTLRITGPFLLCPFFECF